MAAGSSRCCYNLLRAVPWSAAACSVGSVTGIMICAHVKDDVIGSLRQVGPWVEALPAADKLTMCFIATCIVNGGVLLLGFLGSGKLREIIFGTLFRIFDCFGNAGGVTQQVIGLLIVVVLGLALWGAFVLQLMLTYAILLFWFTLATSRTACQEPTGKATAHAQIVVDLINRRFHDGSVLKDVSVANVCKLGDTLGNRAFMMLVGCLLIVVCQAGMLASMVYYKERIWAETVVTKTARSNRKKRKKKNKRKHHSDSDDSASQDDSPSEIELPPMYSHTELPPMFTDDKVTEVRKSSHFMAIDSLDSRKSTLTDAKEAPLLDPRTSAFTSFVTDKKQAEKKDETEVGTPSETATTQSWGT